MGRKRLTGWPMLKKCSTVVDWISELPDDVIVHILSLLPFEQAAATSLLSHRWLHLWKYRPKLQFKVRDTCTINPQRNLDDMNWVNSVLKSHRGSLQELTIDFYLTKSNRYEESNWYEVAKWLEFAFQKRVESIDWNLNFTFEMPTVLKQILENVTIPVSAGIQSLKVLYLRNITTTGDGIQFLLRNCPMLERLVFQSLAITSDLEVVGLSLKHLKIGSHRSCEFSIKIVAPNLTLLEIDCATRSFFLESAPKCVNLYLRCWDTIHDFATAASQLETLAISLDRLEAPFSVPEMPKLKKLVIHDKCCVLIRGHLPFPITCLLRASPCLEEFEVEITRLTLEEGVLEVPKVGPIFRHLNLKRFKLFWFCGGSPCRDRIDLMRYIVDNCVALEEIDIRQCDVTKWRSGFYAVDDDCVHVATAEERETVENIMQLKLPAHIKLCTVNHTHRYIPPPPAWITYP